jgi:lysophospholipase L1-like esterase
MTPSRSTRAAGSGSQVITIRSVAAGGAQNVRILTGGRTYGQNWHLEQNFDFVRLIFMNDAGPGLVVGPVAIASSAYADANPVRTDGTPAPMVPVTFANQGRDVALAEQILALANSRSKSSKVWSSSAADHTYAGLLTMPGVPNLSTSQVTWVPQLYFSDWIPVTSLPRGDGGTGCFLHTRAAVPIRRVGRGTIYNPELTGTLLAAADRGYEAFWQDGDAISIPAPMTKDARGLGLVYGVQVLARVDGYVVQGVGDSIMQGVGSHGDFCGFGPRACARVSRENVPVHWLQSATGGSPSLAFFQAGLQDMKAGHVSVALIQTWSGNDFQHGMSVAEAQDVADAGWQRAVAYGYATKAQGGVPVYVTAVPQRLRTSTPELDATRLSTVARCHELASRGELVLDLNSILGDGGAASGVVDYKRDLSADAFHPNDRGHDLVAGILAPMIESVVRS